jgi:predicted flavoprotein YhiN
MSEIIINDNIKTKPKTYKRLAPHEWKSLTILMAWAQHLAQFGTKQEHEEVVKELDEYKNRVFTIK